LRLTAANPAETRPALAGRAPSGAAGRRAGLQGQSKPVADGMTEGANPMQATTFTKLFAATALTVAVAAFAGIIAI
jgi:hypothetical protein